MVKTTNILYFLSPNYETHQGKTVRLTRRDELIRSENFLQIPSFHRSLFPSQI